MSHKVRELNWLQAEAQTENRPKSWIVWNKYSWSFAIAFSKILKIYVDIQSRAVNKSLNTWMYKSFCIKIYGQSDRSVEDWS